MNFYKRNIGDYRKKTARLTPLEVGVYDLLLDEIYATEEPLPLDEGELFNIVGARTDADEAAVRKVLGRYFERSDVGWTNARASEEIAAAQAQARTNKRIAQEREAKRSAPSNGAYHEPCNASSTNARSRETPDSRLQKESDSFDETEFEAWWQLVPRKQGKGQARPAYKRALKKTDADTLLAGIQRYAEAVRGKESQYIRLPATWLNGEGWLDEPDPEPQDDWRQERERQKAEREARKRQFAEDAAP